jgi:hypothetical protein
MSRNKEERLVEEPFEKLVRLIRYGQQLPGAVAVARKNCLILLVHTADMMSACE